MKPIIALLSLSCHEQNKPTNIVSNARERQAGKFNLKGRSLEIIYGHKNHRPLSGSNPGPRVPPPPILTPELQWLCFRSDYNCFLLAQNFISEKEQIRSVKKINSSVKITQEVKDWSKTTAQNRSGKNVAEKNVYKNCFTLGSIAIKFYQFISYKKNKTKTFFSCLMATGNHPKLFQFLNFCQEQNEVIALLHPQLLKHSTN